MPVDFLQLGIPLGDSQLPYTMDFSNSKPGNLTTPLVPVHLVETVDPGLFEVFAEQPSSMEFLSGNAISGHNLRDGCISLTPALDGDCNARQHKVRAVAGDLRHTRLVQVAEVHKK